MLGQIEVFHNAHVWHHGIFLPVGGQHGHAVFHKADNAALQAPAVNPHGPALGGEGAEHGLHQLAGPAAGQAGEGHHLSLFHIQVDAVEALAGVALQLQNGVP